MFDRNKTLFRLSILLNLLFLTLASFWLLKKINLSLDGKIDRATRTQVKPREVYRTRYYFLHVAQFESLPKSQNDILLVGDSLTDQGEWNELLNNPYLKNRGISGDTTDGILYRIEQIVEGQPRKIFIMIGANDFWHEKKSIAEVLQNYKLILDTFQKKAPNTKVYVQSLLPIDNTNFNVTLDNSTLSEFNQQLEQLVEDYPYQYINLYPHFLNPDNQLDLQYTSDGVHLNGRGYLVWRNQIEKYINK
jgi:lysophospholipase L1-like esterase